MTSRTGTAAPGREGGFTLIELLVVVIILGILSAVVVFAVRGVGNKGRDQAVATDRRTIRTAQEAYCAQAGQYASMDQLTGATEAANGNKYKLLSEPSTYHEVTATPDSGGPCNGWSYRIDEVGLPNVTVPTIPTTTSTTTNTGPTGPSWRLTTPLDQCQQPSADCTARSRQTATALADGRVLVVGGAPNKPPSAQVYNPADETWKATGTPKDGLGSTATLLPSGKVLVIGNRPAGEPPARVYDPVTNEWEKVEAPLPFGAFTEVPTATLLTVGQDQGKVLVTGLNNVCPVFPGTGSSSAVIFDPQPSVPGAHWGQPIPMLNERMTNAMAVGLHDGRVLVAGGQTCLGNGIRPAGAEVFDPVDRTFRPTDLPVHPIVFGTLTLLAKGTCGGAECRKVLMTGTPISNKDDAAQLFDPTAAPSTPGGAAVGRWSAVPNMTVGHFGHTATLLENSGKVLVAGGSTATATTNVYRDDAAEIYDPATNTWDDAAVPDMLPPGASHASAVLLQGDTCGNRCGVLVTGGSYSVKIDDNRSESFTIPAAQIYSPGSG